MSDLTPVTVVGDEGWVGENLPTPRRLVSSQWEHVADQLRTRPGMWKHIAVAEREEWYVPLRTGGLISQLERAGCEVATRTRIDGKVNLYARFIGDGAPKAPNRPGRVDWQETLTPVMETPGRWVQVASFSDTARAVRAQRNLTFRRCRVPVGDWEFKVVGDGLYAKYETADEAAS